VQQTITQYYSMCDLQGYAESSENFLWHSLVQGRSRPKNAVSEGFMTLATDKKPEATCSLD